MTAAQSVQRSVYIYTTPAELRALADEMEAKSKTIRLGESCVIKEVPVDKETVILVSWDHTSRK